MNSVSRTLLLLLNRGTGRLGFSSAELGCGPRAGLILRYQAYPGGPYTNTTQYFATNYVSRVQGGTQNGYHRAFTSGGSQVA